MISKKAAERVMKILVIFVAISTVLSMVVLF